MFPYLFQESQAASCFPPFTVAKTPLQPTKLLSHKPRKSATMHAERNSH